MLQTGLTKDVMQLNSTFTFVFTHNSMYPYRLRNFLQRKQKPIQKW